MFQLTAPQPQNKSQAFACLELTRARADAALAQEAFTATHSAIVAVKAAAAFHRKTYHTKHIPKPFQEALDCLDLQLTGNRAALDRAQSEILSIVDHDVSYLPEARFGELCKEQSNPMD
jgi:hypothetical protein